MCWCKPHVLLVAGLLLAAMPAAAGDFVIAVGAERDTEETGSLAGLAEIAVADSTWLSLALARSSVETLRGGDLETVYASAGIDHHFDPVGLRFDIAYWGDSDVLDSRDLRPTVYWRNERASLSLHYEYRDFEFVLPPTDLLPEREVPFTADGIGASGSIDVGEAGNLFASLMHYDYSVDLRLDPNRDIVRLLPLTRLSLISSLLDERAALGVGVDVGNSRWELELGTSVAAVDGSRSRMASVRLLTPVSRRTDIEFGLGFDDNDLYGEIFVASLFVFFYGG